MFISKKKFKKAIATGEARGFANGYELGYRCGKENAMYEKHTINQIRAACGLSPISDGKKADTLVVDESSKEE